MHPRKRGWSARSGPRGVYHKISPRIVAAGRGGWLSSEDEASVRWLLWRTTYSLPTHRPPPPGWMDDFRILYVVRHAQSQDWTDNNIVRSWDTQNTYIVRLQHRASLHHGGNSSEWYGWAEELKAWCPVIVYLKLYPQRYVDTSLPRVECGGGPHSGNCKHNQS